LSETLRVTSLATAGVPTLSEGTRISGLPCNLKKVTYARKVATTAGRQSPRAQNSLPQSRPTPRTPPVHHYRFEAGASKWKPGHPGQKSNQLFDYHGNPPTDQSIPRNSEPNPNLHESQAPNIREGIWDEIFERKGNGNLCPYISRGGDAWAVVRKNVGAHRHPPGYGIK
jgi:hypothetical protein